MGSNNNNVGKGFFLKLRVVLSCKLITSYVVQQLCKYDKGLEQNTGKYTSILIWTKEDYRDHNWRHRNTCLSERNIHAYCDYGNERLYWDIPKNKNLLTPKSIHENTRWKWSNYEDNPTLVWLNWCHDTTCVENDKDILVWITFGKITIHLWYLVFNPEKHHQHQCCSS